MAEPEVLGVDFLREAARDRASSDLEKVVSVNVAFGERRLESNDCCAAFAFVADERGAAAIQPGDLFDDALVEPNSALGEAINYLLKRWDAMTLFLRKAGAPLDNNICERALKKAILHRKNSMFFKSEKGARTGDAFMSLIYTCELNGANPFDYLTELQRHAKDLAAAPHNWMPWNYRETLAAITTPSVPVC